AGVARIAARVGRRVALSAPREVRESRLARAPLGARERGRRGVHGARRRRRGADGGRMTATRPLTALAARTDFPLLAAQPELHYLDSAATTQKPRAVLDAMLRYYEHDNANPHRGAYALSARATERYHAARERVARFIGVRDSARVIFVRGTTEGL